MPQDLPAAMRLAMIGQPVPPELLTDDRENAITVPPLPTEPTAPAPQRLASSPRERLVREHAQPPQQSPALDDRDAFERRMERLGLDE